MTLEFRPAEGGGVEVFDPIERHQCVFGTPEPVTIEPVDADGIDYPVDDAVAIETDELELPEWRGIIVHDDNGDVLNDIRSHQNVSFPCSEYALELSCPIKTYLLFEAGVDIEADEGQRSITFDQSTRVVVSARSRHEHPKATISTTEDPADIMTAVSYLGSALKTTSPERSFPTLRGHPPLIEVGDELDVPDSLDKPNTGVTIEIPPDYASIFVVSPLAFYLGATVVPGEQPRIVTDSGYVHSLSTSGNFEEEVERVLKQTHLLDCIVRTEGLYELDLHQRQELEKQPEFDLNCESLYDASIGEQLEAYLSIPFETVREQVPEWKRVAYVQPSARRIPYIPHLVYDLSVVRTGPNLDWNADDEGDDTDAIDEFLRDDFRRRIGSMPESDFLRSVGSTRTATRGTTTSIWEMNSSEENALEYVWVGDREAPSGMSEPTLDAFKNNLDRTSSDGEIDILVVCNDREMEREFEHVKQTYGNRENIPQNIDVRDNVRVGELESLLQDDIAFFHFIGHINEDGFICPDGRLDASRLESTGVYSFFLNACSSREQGLALLEAGAISGIVTRTDVANSGATEVGRNLAELLNAGFPMYGGIEIAQQNEHNHPQYFIIGDGTFTVHQFDGGPADVHWVDCKPNDSVELITRMYPDYYFGLGNVSRPPFEGSSSYYLTSGNTFQVEITYSELENYLVYQPCIFEGEIYWPGELLEKLDLEND